MRTKHLFFLLVSLPMIFCFSGCATLRTVSSASLESPKIYSGARLDYNAIVGDNARIEAKFKVQPPKYPTLDFPLSVALDTAVLPLTSSVALYEAVFE